MLHFLGIQVRKQTDKIYLLYDSHGQDDFLLFPLLAGETTTRHFWEALTYLLDIVP